jgi:hypothetical protein
MEHRIGCQKSSTHVIAPKSRRRWKINMKFCKDKFYPNKFCTGKGNVAVFNLGDGPSNGVLLLGIPRDQIWTKENTIA